MSARFQTQGPPAEAVRRLLPSGLAASLEEAKAKGIFGAPSFVVGEELFWGDDRLEDALDWAGAR